MPKPKLSLVIPLYNESENIQLLFERLKSIRNTLKPEIVLVNDGSTDDTVKQLQKRTGFTLVDLRRNFGQTAAILAGIKTATGDIIITLDGDGQNDPDDIPNMLKTLEQGFDVVCGWRRDRHDPFSKKIISRGADLLRKMILKDSIHDSGCTLKVYRRECFEDLDLYGEMHRFIPAIMAWKGFKITETPVKHHPRKFGRSKYGFARTFKGLIDMINVWFWYRYSARPLHLFGGLGLLLTFLGVIILLTLALLRLVYGVPLSERIWPLVGFFSIMAGIQLFVSGILADIAIKTYFTAPHKSSYSIRQIKHY